MQYRAPLQAARLIRRYKRFLADVRLADGACLTVHCANSGSMATCAMPDSEVLLSDSQSLTRKLRYTWELIAVDGTWVGVNTAIPNAAVSHFIRAGQVAPLSGYAGLRREVPYGTDGRCRIDMLLEDPARPACYVEVKNATMRVGEHAAFPDAVTLRGQKHLRELMILAATGRRAVMFYYVGRSDCRRFRPADEVDPAYGMLLRQAVLAGVEALAYRVEYSRLGVRIVDAVPIDL